MERHTHERRAVNHAEPINAADRELQGDAEVPSATSQPCSVESLAVVIPTAGRPDLLSRTLASLADCERPQQHRATIVIENGARSGAEEVVRNCPLALGARYLYCAAGNKSRALNEVLARLDEWQLSGDPLLVLYDDDVRLDPHNLSAYVSAATRARKRHFFGRPLHIEYETEPAAWLKSYLPASATGWDLEVAQSFREQRLYVSGANWAAFASDLKRAGGFNELKGPGAATGSIGQETDMQDRLSELGVAGCFVPEAQAWHFVPADRCSPAWARRRAYRRGVSHGLDLDESSARLCGLPRWMLRDWLRRYWRFVTTRWASDPETRFLAARDLNWLSGVLKGIRIQRKSGSPVGAARGEGANA